MSACCRHFARRSTILAIGVALMVASFAPNALAAGAGVVEINQAAVGQGGITSFDPPGFPAVLSSPGSYVLTSDLIVPDASTTAILVTADDVRIDLAGFSIRGVVTCSPQAGSVVCTPSGTGIGIDSTGEHTWIKDGSIRGMGSDGIRVDVSARVERVGLSDNADDGLQMGLFGSARGVRAERNAENGINLGSSSRLVASQAFGNGRYGIRAATNVIIDSVQAAANQFGGIFGTDVMIVGSTISGNQGGGGIIFDSSAILRDNLVIGNAGNGISTLLGTTSLPGDDAVIAGNLVRNNAAAGIQGIVAGVIEGNVMTDNGTSGIACFGIAEDGEGCLIAGNVSNRNGTGLSGFGSTAYLNNIISGNTTSASPTAQQLGTNFCDETTTCP